MIKKIMPTNILMPALSPTMTSGTLSKWNKQEGDAVAAGDVLCEIETDKANMEVEAVDEGVLLKILIPGGTPNVAVNTPIAVLVEPGESDADVEAFLAALPLPSSAAPIPASEPSAPAAATPVTNPESLPAGDRVFASPLAKRMAQQDNIDLRNVSGTGPHGRIIKRDILSYAPVATPAPTTHTPTTHATTSTPTLHMEPIGQIGAFEDVYLSTMRKKIGENLSFSKQTIPHFYVTVSVQMEALLELRGTLNEKDRESKLTINDFVVKATSNALMEFPDVNATFHQDYYRRYHAVDMAIAVSIDGGLITPIVKEADKKSIRAVSQEIKVLAEKAKKGQLRPEEYQEGSFTISNLGMYGVAHFQPIIKPPQVAILGVGGIFEQRMNLTLAADHRVVDGALAAQFLRCIQRYLEDPIMILVGGPSRA